MGSSTPESKKNPKTYSDAERTGESVQSIIKLGKKSTAFVRSRLPVGTEVRLQLFYLVVDCFPVSPFLGTAEYDPHVVKFAFRNERAVG